MVNNPEYVKPTGSNMVCTLCPYDSYLAPDGLSCICDDENATWDSESNECVITAVSDVELPTPCATMNADGSCATCATGTVEIYNAEDLNAIRYCLNGDYKLVANINLADSPQYKENWTPIGTEAKPFAGKFYGNGFYIVDMKINNSELNYAGLFGVANGATIDKVTMYSTNVSASSIKAQNNVGAIVGKAIDTTIENSFSNLTIDAQNNVGGLVGEVADEDGSANLIRNSYSYSLINAKNNVGGLVGQAANLEVKTSYFAGAFGANNVTSMTNVGAIIGFEENETKNVITNTYFDIDKISNLQNDEGVSVQPQIGNDINTNKLGGKATQEMQVQKPYDSTWKSNWVFGASVYPVLKHHRCIAYGEKWEGFVNESCIMPFNIDKYGACKTGVLEVKNAYDLDAIRYCPTGNYKLVANIDFANAPELQVGAGFMPIGNQYEAFTGTFDGGNYHINNLKINRPNEDNVGLFGYTMNNDVAIKDLKLKYATVIGKSNVGALVGNNNAQIENILVEADVTGGNNVGGIIGNSGFANDRRNNLTKLYANGVVTLTGSAIENEMPLAGGVVATCMGDIENAYAKVEVKATGQVASIGGLVAHIDGALRDVYFNGAFSTMHKNTKVGGLAISANANNPVIKRAYVVADMSKTYANESENATNLASVIAEVKGNADRITNVYVDNNVMREGVKDGFKRTIENGFDAYVTPLEFAKEKSTVDLQKVEEMQTVFTSPWSLAEGKYPELREDAVVNRYCEANTYFEDDACVACPANSISQTGAISLEDCVCEDGYFRYEETIPEVSYDLCTACPADSEVTADGKGCECKGNKEWNFATNTCECKLGYTEDENGECVVKALCPVDAEWIEETNTCECNLEGAQIVDGMCECPVAGMVVYDGTCICQNGGVFDEDANTCLCAENQIEYEGTCIDAPMNAEPNQDETGFRCKDNFYQIGEGMDIVCVECKDGSTSTTGAQKGAEVCTCPYGQTWDRLNNVCMCNDDEYKNYGSTEPIITNLAYQFNEYETEVIYDENVYSVYNVTASGMNYKAIKIDNVEYLLIQTFEQFDNIRNDSYKNYILMNDIEFNALNPITNGSCSDKDGNSLSGFINAIECSYANIENVWTPSEGINKFESINEFDGILDGNGHVIKHILGNISKDENGFINPSYLINNNYGVVKNLGVRDSYNIFLARYNTAKRSGGMVDKNAIITNVYMDSCVIMGTAPNDYFAGYGLLVFENTGSITNSFVSNNYIFLYTIQDRSSVLGGYDLAVAGIAYLNHYYYDGIIVNTYVNNNHFIVKRLGTEETIALFGITQEYDNVYNSAVYDNYFEKSDVFRQFLSTEEACNNCYAENNYYAGTLFLSEYSDKNVLNNKVLAMLPGSTWTNETCKKLHFMGVDNSCYAGDAWDLSSEYPTLKSINQRTTMPELNDDYVCTKCPPGAYSNENQSACICEDANANWSSATNSCVCQEGYVEENASCVQDCGENSSFKDGLCICDQGYFKTESDVFVWSYANGIKSVVHNGKTYEVKISENIDFGTKIDSMQYIVVDFKPYYLITNKLELDAIRTNEMTLSLSYILMNDLYMNANNPNELGTCSLDYDNAHDCVRNLGVWQVNPSISKWSPIGTSQTEFKGDLNGNGYTIHNLYLGSSGGAYFDGLFSKIENATIANLYFENAFVNSEEGYTGVLAGYADVSLIRNVSVNNSAFVFAKSVSEQGAIIGNANESQAYKLSVENNTYYKAHCGLIGLHFSSSLTDSYVENNFFVDTPIALADSGVIKNVYVANNTFKLSDFNSCPYNGTGGYRVGLLSKTARKIENAYVYNNQLDISTKCPLKLGLLTAAALDVKNSYAQNNTVNLEYTGTKETHNISLGTIGIFIVSDLDLKHVYSKDNKFSYKSPYDNVRVSDFTSNYTISRSTALGAGWVGMAIPGVNVDLIQDNEVSASWATPTNEQICSDPDLIEWLEDYGEIKVDPNDIYISSQEECIALDLASTFNVNIQQKDDSWFKSDEVIEYLGDAFEWQDGIDHPVLKSSVMPQKLRNACVGCPQNSYSSADRTSCICVHDYEQWNEDTNSCECVDGYVKVDNKCVVKVICDDSAIYDDVTNTCYCYDENMIMNASGVCECPSEMQLNGNICECKNGGIYDGIQCDCATDSYRSGDTCIACPALQQVNAAGTGCECVSGTYDVSGTCVLCPIGSTSKGGSVTSCECADGLVWNDSTSTCICRGDRIAVPVNKEHKFVYTNTGVINGVAKTGTETFGSQTFDKYVIDDVTYYVIDTKEKLKAVASKLAYNYILMTDIDLTDFTMSSLTNYTGIFEGNGYELKNLTFGLFKILKGAQINDLGLVNVQIDTTLATGALATGALATTVQAGCRNQYGASVNALTQEICETRGTCSDTTYTTQEDCEANSETWTNNVWVLSHINNVYAKNVKIFATGRTTNVGALAVILNHGSKISNSYVVNVDINTTPVNVASSYAGGLVAKLTQGFVENSYVINSKLNVGGYAGGFVGYLEAGKITNSYVLGGANSYAKDKGIKGAFVGAFAGANEATIENCYYDSGIIVKVGNEAAKLAGDEFAVDGQAQEGVTALRAEQFATMANLGEAWNYDTMYPTLKTNAEPTGYICSACPANSIYDNGVCVCDDANATWNAGTNTCDCNSEYYKDGDACVMDCPENAIFKDGECVCNKGFFKVVEGDEKRVHPVTIPEGAPSVTIDGELYVVIRDLVDLEAIRENPSGNYILANDIKMNNLSPVHDGTCENESWDNGIYCIWAGPSWTLPAGLVAWKPIGSGADWSSDNYSDEQSCLDAGYGWDGEYCYNTEAGCIASGKIWEADSETCYSAFTGKFNGNGYIISNMYIDGADSEYYALFGFTYGATITNVGIEDSYIDAHEYDYSGALVGRTEASTTIDNCYSLNNIVLGDRIGALIGFSSASTISNSYAVNNLLGNPSMCFRIGGLTGANYRGTIVNCYSRSNWLLNPFDAVGGLSGNNSGTIANSYSFNNYMSEYPYYYGELVGDKQTGTVTNCYHNDEDSVGEYTSGFSTNEEVNSALGSAFELSDSGYPILKSNPEYSENTDGEFTCSACPVNSKVSADGLSCECDVTNAIWSVETGICECDEEAGYGLNYAGTECILLAICEGGSELDIESGSCICGDDPQAWYEDSQCKCPAGATFNPESGYCECPNGALIDNDCECMRDEYTDGETGQCTIIPENAVINNERDDFECRSGYYRVDEAGIGSCVKCEKGSHSSQGMYACECNKANFRWDANVEETCTTCQDGYVLKNGRCVPAVTCPAHSEQVGDNCICADGYVSNMSQREHIEIKGYDTHVTVDGEVYRVIRTATDLAQVNDKLDGNYILANDILMNPVNPNENGTCKDKNGNDVTSTHKTAQLCVVGGICSDAIYTDAVACKVAGKIWTNNTWTVDETKVPNKWTAIGTSATPFAGKFNGNGYAIKNMYLNVAVQEQALFAFVGTGALVDNLGVMDSYAESTTSGRARFAVMVNQNKGTISNCYVMDTVTVSENYDVAAFVTVNFGTIKNSYVINNVIKGSSSTGAAIGVHDSGNIYNIYAIGNTVFGAGNVAAISGYRYVGKMFNTYAMNNTVIGSSSVGAYIGWGQGGSAVDINTYSINNTIAANSTGGCLIGKGVGTFTNAVVDDLTTYNGAQCKDGVNFYGSFTGTATDVRRNNAFFSSSDFLTALNTENVTYGVAGSQWEQRTGASYPTLISNPPMHGVDNGQICSACPEGKYCEQGEVLSCPEYATVENNACKCNADTNAVWNKEIDDCECQIIGTYWDAMQNKCVCVSGGIVDDGECVCGDGDYMADGYCTSCPDGSKVTADGFGCEPKDNKALWDEDYNDLYCADGYRPFVNADRIKIVPDGSATIGEIEFETMTIDETNWYIVRTKEQLQAINTDVNSLKGNYILANDIYINDKKPTTYGTCSLPQYKNALDCGRNDGTWTPNPSIFKDSWTPIGGTIDETITTSEECAAIDGEWVNPTGSGVYDKGCYRFFFKGNFNGNGYVVRNMYIKSPFMIQGLFGHISSATISNLGLVDSFVQAHHYSAGVVGITYAGSVNNIYAIDNVVIGAFNASAIVGNSSSQMSNCYAIRNNIIASSNYTGALVGTLRATLSNSYAVDNYIKGTHSGGCVGYNSVGAIINTYSLNNEIHSSVLGGLVGIQYSASVLNSYSIKNRLLGGSSAAGGLVGRNFNASTITNSYSIGNTVTASKQVGGFVGVNSGNNDNTDKFSTIDNVYSIDNKVYINSATEQTVGYLYGQNDAGNTIKNAIYYNTKAYRNGVEIVEEVVGFNNSGNLENVGKSTDSSTYENWVDKNLLAKLNAENYIDKDGSGAWNGSEPKAEANQWEMKSGNEYPTLISNPQIEFACEVCPIGYFCEDGIQMPCPQNHTTSRKGATSVAGCDVCVEGYILEDGACVVGVDCPENSTAVNGACVCNAGYYEQSAGGVHRTFTEDELANGVTSDGYIIIKDLAGLDEIRNNLTGKYILANDIKMNAQSPVNVGTCAGATADNAYDCHKAGGTWTPDANVFTTSWTPIGTGTDEWCWEDENGYRESNCEAAGCTWNASDEWCEDNEARCLAAGKIWTGTRCHGKFAGEFNGNGYQIKNMYIDSFDGFGAYAQMYGLFATATDDATISNVGVVNSYVAYTDHFSTAALVGSGGNVSNCYSTGNMIIGSSSAAGLVGAGNVVNSYATGNVIVSGNEVAGLGISSSSITNSYALNNIVSGEVVGGLFADTEYSISTNSYHDGVNNGVGEYKDTSWFATEEASNTLGSAFVLTNGKYPTLVSNPEASGEVAGIFICSICPAGSWCADGIQTSCEVGWTSDAGSDEEIDCNRCADDYISLDGACVTCPNGSTWQSSGICDPDHDSVVWDSADNTLKCLDAENAIYDDETNTCFECKSGLNMTMDEDTWLCECSDGYTDDGNGVCILECDASQNLVWSDETKGCICDDGYYLGVPDNSIHPVAIGDYDETVEIDGEQYTVIRDRAGLTKVKDNLAGNYILADDIDMQSGVKNYTKVVSKMEKITTSMTINKINEYASNLDDLSPKTWTPIGTADAPFTGKFNGNGYAVKYLYVNASTTHQGLFGHVNSADAVISNVGVEASFVETTAHYAGSLIGRISAGKVENCYGVNNKILGSSAIGGLIGSNVAESVSNSYVIKSFIGTSADELGCLIGENINTNVENCYTKENKVITLKTDSYVGGLAGSNANSTITNCYAVDNTVSGNNYKGGLAGSNITTSTITNSYHNSSIEGGNSIGTYKASFTPDMFVGYDENIWDLSTTYPTLKSIPEPITTEECLVCSAGSYCVGGDITDCPMGQYSDVGATECINCPAGEYSRLGASECTNCAAGYYCTDGKQTLCPDGWMSLEGASNVNECNLCDGEYIVINGACQPCPEGSNWVAGVCVPEDETDFWDGDTNTLVCNVGYYYGIPDNRVHPISISSSATTVEIDGEPYTVIRDRAGLTKVKDNLAGNYILADDIDMQSGVKNYTKVVSKLEELSTSISAIGTYTSNLKNLSPRTWTPIGTSSTPFTGKFNGNGYAVKYLYVNATTTYQGLFGHVNSADAVISNLGIEASFIKSTNYWVGGLIGLVSAGKVENCYAINNKVLGHSAVGGLIGQNASSLTNSYVIKTLVRASSENKAGGLIGQNVNANVENCYSSSNKVYSDDSPAYAGGLIGYSGNSVITNCYAVGTSVTSASASATDKGGLIGAQSTSTITNSYHNGKDNGIGTYKASFTSDMFVGYDENIWDLSTTYPTLKTTPVPITTEDCVACPVGWTTTSTGATAKTACNTCVDGYISQNGECVRSCDASANEIWSAAAQSCVCVDGSYSDAGMCLTCPAGAYCADGVQTQCPAGTYSAAGAKECVSCESGAISSAGATECTICEAGTYANAAATECTSCQTGTTSDAGATQASDCNRCAQGYVSVGGSCVTCPAGTIWGDTSTCIPDNETTEWDSESGKLKCTDETYAEMDEDTHICTCVANMEDSDGDGMCECSEGYKMENGVCVVELTCGENAAPNAEKTECVCNDGYAIGIPDTRTHLSDAELEEQGYTVIKTLAELENVRNNLAGKYALGADIYINEQSPVEVGSCSVEIPAGEGTKAYRCHKANGTWTPDTSVFTTSWTPIGNGTTNFTGNFNGNGYEISNLYINSTSQEQGLFGYTEGATISNVGVVDSYVKGSYCVGGLVGSNYTNSTVTNSYATNNVVTGSSYDVGGLVGFTYTNSTITNSYAINNVVTGSNTVGGLVGLNNNSTITNSYAINNVVTGSNTVGGLVGFTYTNSTVSNSYATGNTVSGSDYVGGLLGYNGGIVTNSYATNNVVTGSSNYVGGLLGYNSSIDTTVKNSKVASTNTCNDSTCVIIGTDKNSANTTVEENDSFFAGNAFATNLNANITSLSLTDASQWEMVAGNDHPTLVYNPESQQMCLSCPAGSCCVGGVQTSCPTGTTSDAGATLITQCYATEDDMAKVEEDGKVNCYSDTGELIEGAIFEDGFCFCDTGVILDGSQTSCEVSIEGVTVEGIDTIGDVEFKTGTLDGETWYIIETRKQMYAIASDSTAWTSSYNYILANDISLNDYNPNEYGICTGKDGADLTSTYSTAQACVAEGYCSNASYTDMVACKKASTSNTWTFNTWKPQHEAYEFEGWTSIGTSSIPFRGKFNGNGHEISYMNAVNHNSLFQSLSGATISNIGIVDSYSDGTSVLIGGTTRLYGETAFVTNAYSKNNTLVSYGSGGALIGRNVAGSISNSYSLGNTIVSNYQSLGGFVGQNSDFISNCYSANNIVLSTGDYVGGFIGAADLASSEINSFAVLNTVRGQSYVAGFGAVGNLSSGYAASNVVEGSGTKIVELYSDFEAGTYKAESGQLDDSFFSSDSFLAGLNNASNTQYDVAEANQWEWLDGKDYPTLISNPE